MSEPIRTIIYPVRDLERAKAVYSALLGQAPAVEQPWYVGFDIGGQHIGLDPNGHAAGMKGPVAYRHVPDIEAAADALVAAGAVRHGEAKAVGGGRLVAMMLDTDGNGIGLIQDT